MIKRTFGILLGGACLGLAVALAAMLAPADAGPPITAWLNHTVTIDDRAADLHASIEALDLLDVVETVPAHDAFKVATIAGDGLTCTDRLKRIQDGGRVKSAASLLVAPASRFSARV